MGFYGSNDPTSSVKALKEEYTVMAEGSVGSVWHKSLANLPSITVDPLFPSFLVYRKVMKI